MSILDRPGKMRWRGSDWFALSESGQRRQSEYQERIVEARGEGGRHSYDTARLAWARDVGVEPEDGVYLSELNDGSVKLSTLVDALESCGKSKRDALAALGRLVDAGLVQVVDPARARER